MDSHAILLVQKWRIQDDFTARQRDKNEEQTKFRAYGEQLELKSGLKSSVMMALGTCTLGLSAVEL